MFKIKKLDFLIALYVTCIAVAELMGAKTFPIMKIGGFSLSASVAIFVIPLIFTINDIVVEVYGKERAQSIVRSGLLMIALLLGFSALATSLPPTQRFAHLESAYDAVFIFSMRISLASLTAFTIAEFMDVAIFSRLRVRFGKKKLWLRNNLSNFISQFFDTSIFMFLAFYAFNKSFDDNLLFLIGLILPYWLLKCCMSVIETPFVYIGVRWLQSEKK